MVPFPLVTLATDKLSWNLKGGSPGSAHSLPQEKIIMLCVHMKAFFFFFLHDSPFGNRDHAI